MPVEGIPQRDQIVTFTAPYASYHEGEVAAFTVEEAQRLADLGVAVTGDASTDPPVNFTVPHAMQAGAELTCTMGEWTGSPTTYAYQWQIDGEDVGTDSPTHPVTPADAGTTATCIVTATNANGSTAAPPSNAVVVT